MSNKFGICKILRLRYGEDKMFEFEFKELEMSKIWSCEMKVLKKRCF